MPRTTALYDEHVKLGARMVDFHGWLLPVQYEGILAEHHQCRSAVAVFDTSHMGQFVISGPQAAAALSAALTQDATSLAIGQGRYGFLLNQDGGIIDDTILMRLADEEFLLVVNAATAAGDFDCLSAALAGKARLVNRSQALWGKLDIQGPRSLEALAPLLDTDIKGLRYFHVTSCRCLGQPCQVSRTGYTGELGYELLAHDEHIVKVFQSLMQSPLAKPAGLGARDMLRLEMCYPLYGQDIDEHTTPLEADLGRFVDLGRNFTGSAVIAQQAQEGLSRWLIAFRSDSRQRAMHGQDIMCDGAKVGTVTSAGFSPSLGVSIGMGYVQAALASPGQRLDIKTDRGPLSVQVAEKPLYRNGSCRNRK